MFAISTFLYNYAVSRFLHALAYIHMTNHLNKHQFISFLKFKAEANSD